MLNDLIELQRMAAVRGMKILAVCTERIIEEDKSIITQPKKIIGIECLPSESFFKTNL